VFRQGRYTQTDQKLILQFTFRLISNKTINRVCKAGGKCLCNLWLPCCA